MFIQEADKKVTETLCNTRHAVVPITSILLSDFDKVNAEPGTSGTVNSKQKQEVAREVTTTLCGTSHVVEPANANYLSYFDGVDIEPGTSVNSNQKQEVVREVTTTLCGTNHVVEPVNANCLSYFDNVDAEPGTSGAIHSNPCTVIHEQWNILEEIANVSLPEKWTYIICGNNVIVGMWKVDGSSVKRFVVQSDLIVQVTNSL